MTPGASFWHYGPKDVAVPFGRSVRIVTAGPYAMSEDWHWGVLLAKEIDKGYRVKGPIKDFSVPPVAETEEALRQTIWAMARNAPVYIGCMGGLGRTGLFLSLLVKTLGVSDQPIKWVRQQYQSRAVETSAQEVFVHKFDVSKLQPTAKWAKRTAPLFFWR